MIYSANWEMTLAVIFTSLRIYFLPIIDLKVFFFLAFIFVRWYQYFICGSCESYVFFAIYQCFLFCCWLVVPNGLSHHLAKLKQNKCLFTHRICKYITSSSLHFQKNVYNFCFSGASIFFFLVVFFFFFHSAWKQFAYFIATGQWQRLLFRISMEFTWNYVLERYRIHSTNTETRWNENKMQKKRIMQCKKGKN